MIVAAPVGPVNMITIQRTLLHGRLNGFVTGLGAALGDGIFALLAALGLVAAADLAGPNGAVLQIVGGMFLIVVGVYTVRNAGQDAVKTPQRAATVSKGAQGPISQAFSINLVLTLTNPATLVGLIGIFAGVGGFIESAMTRAEALVLVGGVVAGSALWWAILAAFVSLFSGEMSGRRLLRLNQISGTAILLFGIAMLVRLLLAGGAG